MRRSRRQATTSRVCSCSSTSTASRRTTTRFGHPAGDALLSRLAAKLAAAVGARRQRVPDGRRRVLRAAADARSPDLHADRPGALGERRGLRRHERLRRRGDPGRGDDGLDARCASPTSGCTPTRSARRDPPRDARTSRCCARSPSGSRSCAHHVADVSSLAVRVGRAARPRAGRARGAAAGGGAARRRQARHPGRRPAEARPARRDRVGLHPPATP